MSIDGTFIRAQNARPGRRRQRQPDPLASREAVNAVISELRKALPDLIPHRYSHLSRLLYAVAHYANKPTPTTRKGRKSRWKPYQVEQIRRISLEILNRGTLAVSLTSFVQFYLPILEMPEDVVRQLEAGNINLFEAGQVSRLTEKRTKIPEARIKRRRIALLDAHIQAQAPGSQLRDRVNELLHHYDGNTTMTSSSLEIEILNIAEQIEAATEQPANCLEIGPDHFFNDSLALITGYITEIKPEDIRPGEMENVMTSADELIRVLHSIHKRQSAPIAEKKSL